MNRTWLRQRAPTKPSAAVARSASQIWHTSGYTKPSAAFNHSTQATMDPIALIEATIENRRGPAKPESVAL
jgi:hypothetical protein